MRKIILIMFLFMIFLFSGCGSLPFKSSSNTGPDEVVTGDGLEISEFTFDDEEKYLREIEYRIKFEHFGKNPVVFSQEDVSLSTNKRKGDGSIIFTQESVDNFFKQIFKDAEVKLYDSQSTETFNGDLVIDKGFFCDLSNDDFSYLFTVSYDYKTEFKNNVVIDLKDKEISHDKLTQGAPVKVTDIDLKRSTEGYELRYQLEDRGPGAFLMSTKVKINDFKIQLGKEELSCRAQVELDSGRKKYLEDSEVILSDKQKIITMVCPFDEGEFSLDVPSSTITKGSFNYKYTIAEDGTIYLPDIRDDVCETVE